jgi:hypothetical protein
MVDKRKLAICTFPLGIEGFPTWGFFLFIDGFAVTFFPTAKMSLSSKPKKVKPRGSVKELKLVHTVDRRGRDTIKTEEVKTPRGDRQPSPSKIRGNKSQSPSKRHKVDGYDEDPISFNGEEAGASTKRQTLVFFSQ